MTKHKKEKNSLNSALNGALTSSLRSSLGGNIILPVINGLVVWMETTSKDSFDEGERIDGASVTNWYDINKLSVSKHDSEQTANNNKPTYIKDGINNLPILRFDGGDYLVDIGDESDFDISTPSIFIVASGAGSYISKATTDFSTTDTRRRNLQVISNFFMSGADNNKISLIGAGYNTSDVQIISLISKSNTSHIMRVNGTQDTSTATLFHDQFNDAAFRIGASFTNSSPLTGDIGEIIIYNRALLSYEIDRIEKYLSAKWGIALD